MRKLFLMLLFITVNSCMHHPSGNRKAGNGAYIDSVGYRALEARIALVDNETSGELISEALAVQNDTTREVAQSAFFQSLEESYQRYLKIFTPVRKSKLPEVQCRYDLVETFNLMIIDPQPFINALLHTMSLKELTTVDFHVEPKNADTTLIYVTLTKMASREHGRKVTMSDEDLILSVTRHRATLVTAIP
ncbi:MAG: hypothetical protein OQK82_06950 [Candidatus Pacearchaeota archaeon]|nr:hypothetical protein [Candidatus Pacearchaeota archaeon]